MVEALCPYLNFLEESYIGLLYRSKHVDMDFDLQLGPKCNIEEYIFLKEKDWKFRIVDNASKIDFKLKPALWNRNPVIKYRVFRNQTDFVSLKIPTPFDTKVKLAYNYAEQKVFMSLRGKKEFSDYTNMYYRLVISPLIAIRFRFNFGDSSVYCKINPKTVDIEMEKKILNAKFNININTHLFDKKHYLYYMRVKQKFENMKYYIRVDRSGEGVVFLTCGSLKISDRIKTKINFDKYHGFSTSDNNRTILEHSYDYKINDKIALKLAVIKDMINIREFPTFGLILGLDNR